MPPSSTFSPILYLVALYKMVVQHNHIYEILVNHSKPMQSDGVEQVFIVVVAISI